MQRERWVEISPSQSQLALVVSDHLPNNKPMLLLKINDGYVINNMTLDDRFGPMIRLVKFLHEDRQKFFEKRFRLPNYDDV